MVLGDHRVLDAADIDRQPISLDLYDGDVLLLGGILSVRLQRDHLFTTAYERRPIS